MNQLHGKELNRSRAIACIWDLEGWVWLFFFWNDFCGRQNNPCPLKICLDPNLGNLWLCYVAKGELILQIGFSGWIQCNHKGPHKWKRVAGESESERCESQRNLTDPCWLWMWKGLWAKDFAAACRSWERQGSIFSSLASGRSQHKLLR